MGRIAVHQRSAVRSTSLGQTVPPYASRGCALRRPFAAMPAGCTSAPCSAFVRQRAAAATVSPPRMPYGFLDACPSPSRTPPPGRPTVRAADGDERPTIVPDFDPEAFARDSEIKQRALSRVEGEPTIDQARRLHLDGDHEQALFLVTRLLELVPLHPEATKLSADCRHRHDRDHEVRAQSRRRVPENRLAIVIPDVRSLHAAAKFRPRVKQRPQPRRQHRTRRPRSRGGSRRLYPHVGPTLGPWGARGDPRRRAAPPSVEGGASVRHQFFVITARRTSADRVLSITRVRRRGA